MKLNLGCGNDYKEGYLNCDYISGEKVDKIVDLEKFPYPFEDNSISEIIMQDIFEHLSKPLRVLEEIHRICKNNARIKIRVPHFSSNSAWGDLTHKRAFSSGCFDHFLVDSKSTSLEIQRKTKFILIKKELIFPKPWCLIGFNNIFTKLIKRYEINLHGIFPCSNIYFELKVSK